jgi:hypothetical protein
MPQKKKANGTTEVIGSEISFRELRGILADEIRRLRSGSTTAVTVNALSNAAGKVIQSAKIELEICKFIGKKPNFGLLTSVSESTAKVDEEATPSEPPA